MTDREEKLIQAARKIVCYGCAQGFPVEDHPDEGVVHRAGLGYIDELFTCRATDADDEEQGIMDRALAALRDAADEAKERCISAVETRMKELRAKRDISRLEEHQSLSDAANEAFYCAEAIREAFSDQARERQ